MNGSTLMWKERPAKAIRQAAYKALGIKVAQKASEGNCGCGCNSSGCC